MRSIIAKPEGYGGVVTALDALIRVLCSLPRHMTVQTFFRSLADLKPGAMQTTLVPGQVTAKEAAEAIALKYCLAVLTADPVIIADSCGMVTKHRNEKIATWPLLFCRLLTSSSLSRRYTCCHDAAERPATHDISS